MKFLCALAAVLLLAATPACAQSSIPISQWPIPPTGSPNLTNGDALVVTRGGVSYKTTAGMGGTCPSNQYVSGVTPQGAAICSSTSGITGIQLGVGTAVATPNPFVTGDIHTGIYTLGVGHFDLGISGVNLVDWTSAGEILQGGLEIGSTTGGIPSAGSVNAQSYLINGVPIVTGVGSVFGRTGTVTAQSGDYGVAQITGAAPSASPTFTGNLLVTGTVGSLANGDLALGASSSLGGILTGKGSINDLTIQNSAGANACTLGTGTTTLNCAGLQVGGTGVLTANQAITLSGGATGTGTTAIAVTLSNTAVTGQPITGFSAGAGTVSATDTILQAINKIVGNVAVIAGGVSSFNTRTGAVVPTSGDYTVSQVTGAAPINNASFTGTFAAPVGTITNSMLAGSVAASKLVGTDIATVGTVTSGTWNAAAIGLGFGGTGATTAATAESNLLGNPSAGSYAINCSSGTSCAPTALSAIGVSSFSAGTTGLTPNTGTTGAVSLGGTLNHANGGTDATTLNGAFNNVFETVATTIGDLVYGGASGVPTRLAGNTTATPQFYQSTGTGSAAQAPSLMTGPVAWYWISGNGSQVGHASFRAYCAVNGLTCTSGDQFTNRQNFYMAAQQVFYNSVGFISDASSSAIAQQFITADVENQFTTTTDPNICPEHVHCNVMGTDFPNSIPALASPCTVTNWDGSNCHSDNITFTSISPAGTFGFMPVDITAYSSQFDNLQVWAKDGSNVQRTGMVTGWTWEIFGTRGVKGTITGYTNGETIQLAIGSTLEPGGKCTAVVSGGNLTGCTWLGTRWNITNGAYPLPPAMQSTYWSLPAFTNATGITTFDATQTPNNDCYKAKGLTSGSTGACLTVTWWPTLCSGSAGGSGNSSYGSCTQSNVPEWTFSNSAVAAPFAGNVNITQGGSGNDATQYGQNEAIFSSAQNTTWSGVAQTQGGYYGFYDTAVDQHGDILNPVTPQVGVRLRTGNQHYNMAVIDTPLATGLQLGNNGGNNLSIGMADIFQNSAGIGLTGYAIDANSGGSGTSGTMGVGLPYAFITNTGTCSGCAGGTAAAINVDYQNGGNLINADGTNYSGASSTQANQITTWINFGTHNSANHNGMITGYAPENITASLYNGTIPAGFGLWVWDSSANGFMAGNGAYFMWGAGTPTNGTTGANKTVIGSSYYDTTNGHSYINTGTKASPTWSLQYDASASTGTGSTVMLQASPTTTGTLTAAAANFSGAITAATKLTVGTATPTSAAAALDLSSNTTSSNSSMILPVGTTAARPTGVNGMIRVNTTLNAVENYVAGVWQDVMQPPNIGWRVSQWYTQWGIGGYGTVSSYGTASNSVGFTCHPISVPWPTTLAGGLGFVITANAATTTTNFRICVYPETGGGGPDGNNLVADSGIIAVATTSTGFKSNAPASWSTGSASTVFSGQYWECLFADYNATGTITLVSTNSGSSTNANNASQYGVSTPASTPGTSNSGVSKASLTFGACPSTAPASTALLTTSTPLVWMGK